MSHQGFENPKEAFDFISGGKAVVTLTSAKTNTHFTYKVSLGDGDDIFFVKHLYGSDNSRNGDWAYLGFIKASAGDGVPTTGLIAGRKGLPDAPSFQAFAWTLKHLAAGSIPEQLTIQHNDQCGRCGRDLTDPISIATGLGPVCRSK